MRALIVLAKAPVLGRAKSRLLERSGLSAEDVARLAEAFLRDTLAVASSVAGAQLVLSFAPADSDAYFRSLAPSARLVAQVDGDLGARLEAAFDFAFSLGATRVIAMGMDTPHVAASVLELGFAGLEQAEVVFGPAEDGGYYAVGLRRRPQGNFRAIEWGTPRVLEQSLERARELGLSSALIERCFDVDTSRELQRLARLLRDEPARCRHSAAVLAELGWPRDAAPN